MVKAIGVIRPKTPQNLWRFFLAYRDSKNIYYPTTNRHNSANKDGVENILREKIYNCPHINYRKGIYEKGKSEKIFTWPVRLKLLWLLVSTKRGRALIRYVYGAIKRATKDNPLSAEEWEAATSPFCQLMAERGLDAERIVGAIKKSIAEGE